jgi:hypothetical protein
MKHQGKTPPFRGGHYDTVEEHHAPQRLHIKPATGELESRRIAGVLGPTMIAMIVSEFPLVQPHLYDAQIPPVVYWAWEWSARAKACCSNRSLNSAAVRSRPVAITIMFRSIHLPKVELGRFRDHRLHHHQTGVSRRDLSHVHEQSAAMNRTSE